MEADFIDLNRAQALLATVAAKPLSSMAPATLHAQAAQAAQCGALEVIAPIGVWQRRLRR
jgi:hypothetical protein